MRDETYHIAPEDGGQIVEVAYRLDQDREEIVRRRTDRSNGAERLSRRELDQLDGEFEPWNGAGNLRRLFACQLCGAETADAGLLCDDCADSAYTQVSR